MNESASNRASLSTRILALVFVTLVLCTTAMGDLTWRITQLTNNDTDDADPDISGTNVVWQGWDGSDWQIYSNFAGQLSSNGGSVHPAISGTNVVWDNGHDFQVYGYLDGQLTHISEGMYPDISGRNVVWMGWDGSDWEIYSNYGEPLTNNSTEDGYAAISGTHVVWRTGSDASDFQIVSNLYGQLSSGSTNNGLGGVSGENAVWWGLDGSDYEVYSNLGEGQLTDNEGRNEGYADISGTNVVWTDSDSIFTNFAGQLITSSTLNSFPAISGTNIVWVGWDGNDNKIYMGELVPLPGAVLLGVFGLGFAGLKLRRNTRENES